MTPNDVQTAGRRSFISSLVTLSAVLGFASPQSARGLDAPAERADEPWMTRLKGKHRVVFHSHLASEGIAVRWAQTFLDTQRAPMA